MKKIQVRQPSCKSFIGLNQNLLGNRPCRLGERRWDRSPSRTRHNPWPSCFGHTLCPLGHNQSPRPTIKDQNESQLNLSITPSVSRTCLPPNMMSVVRFKLSIMDSRQEYKLSYLVLITESFTFIAGANNFPDCDI